MSSNSSYRFLNVVLLESSFKRGAEINFGDPEFKNNINADIETKIEDNKLFVTLHLDFKAGKQDDFRILSKISMLGVFEIPEVEDPQLNIDYFGSVNAPAIIFPFVREHLASVSMKAGINPILLPPINFVHLASKKPKNESL